MQLLPKSTILFLRQLLMKGASKSVRIILIKSELCNTSHNKPHDLFSLKKNYIVILIFIHSILSIIFVIKVIINND